MSKMAVVSLGCSKNLVDTEIMLGRLTEGRWELTDNFNEAELILVNTCGFIETAKQESIEQIFEMARYKEPGVGVCRTLAVAGCLVQRYREELSAEIPEVDYWIGLHEIAQIASIVEGNRPDSTDAKPFLNNENLTRYRATLRHTAFVKIAEGCNHFCSYCAIPLIKGKYQSRSAASIVKEIKSLVNDGTKEINLIAQDITMYGSDLPEKMNLYQLLREIVDQAHPEWIRLLYAYPSGLDEELLQYIQSEPTICKYLDLPFQHINGRLLKLMNRNDTPEFLRRQLQMIRTLIPGITLRSTFIVGFPTETEKEFEELLEFIREGHFNHVGVFAYSREERTRAYTMEPQILETIKEERRNRVLETQQGISARFLHEHVNQEERILIDRILPDGRGVGRTQGLAPEVDGVVYIRACKGKPGSFIHAKITGCDEYNLYAEEI